MLEITLSQLFSPVSFPKVHALQQNSIDIPGNVCPCNVVKTTRSEKKTRFEILLVTGHQEIDLSSLHFKCLRCKVGRKMSILPKPPI